MIYISHLLSDQEMKEVIQKTGAGIESIDFSISENLDRFDETVRNYKNRMEYMETDQLTIHGPFLDINPVAYDSQVRKATLYRFEQAYEAAQILGAKKVVYHTCFHPDIYFLMGWPDRMRDFYEEFLNGKEQKEIVLAIENVFDPEWMPLKETIEKIGNAKVQICLDVGHAHCYSKIPVTEWTTGLGTYVTHLHIHNNDGTRDAHLGWEQGTIPWEEILKLLPENKDRTYTIECCSKEAVLQTYEKLVENV